MVFDRPTAFELLDSVSVFLEEKIKWELPKHLTFNVQIAINVINIVKREIDNGKEINESSKKLIADILQQGNSTESLSKAIKDGKIDLDNKELQKVLLEITKMKLSVDNPNYSTYKDLVEWIDRFFISKYT